MRVPNEARGEVALTVGGQDLIILATIDGLARVSAAIKSETLNDMFVRINGGEPNACLAILAYWVVEGDGKAAAESLKLPDLLTIGAAARAAMAAHMPDEDEGGPPGKPAAGQATG